MSTRIVCPNCHTAYNATDDQRGRRVRCKQCQAIFHAVEPGEPATFPAMTESGKGQPPATSLPADPPAGRKPGEQATPNGPSNRKKPARRISALVLLLILGGVGGSLLIIISSVLICLWLWKNPPDTWRVSRAPDPRNAPGGRNLWPMPDVRGNKAGDDDGKDAPVQGAAEQPPADLPPPPRELDFASPLPKNAEPPPPAPASTNSQLLPEVVQTVKRATAYLRVTLADGNVAQGSGFFGVEPGILLTNAHVIGMLRPESQRPRKIEVVFQSGAADERKLSADLLAVDRSADLAVLRVTAPDLPPPLPVRSARNLQETQPVYVFGFPFGAQLGKEITVSQSSVSSLRWENGMLAKVQVNGGMHPGNSGGPVVDASGNVIGVAVSILRATQIHFAVPGDQVYAVLHGRVAGLSLGQPYSEGIQVHVPATLQMIDPLAQLREPALEIWTGEPTPATRPPSTTQPPVQAGDSPHRPAPLKYRDQVAQADVGLPPLPPGKVYWVQPRWTNATGETQWATANVYPLPPPVERKPLQLMFRHQTGSRGTVLNSWLDFKTPGPNGAEHTWIINAETAVTETTEAVDAEELASVHLQYQAYNVKISVDNQAVPDPDEERAARQAIKSLAANLRIDKQGNLIGNEVDWNRIVPGTQAGLARVHENFERALVTMAVPLPNKRVEPGETWGAERTLYLPSRSRAVTARYDVTCTYLGTRQRAGREEAVLRVQGEFRAAPGQAGRGTGRSEGVVGVDLSTGQVSQAEMVLLFDVEMNPSSRLPPSRGKLTLRLRRDLPPANAAD